jgi:hypothetical protein
MTIQPIGVPGCGWTKRHMAISTLDTDGTVAHTKGTTDRITAADRSTHIRMLVACSQEKLARELRIQ